MTTDRKYEHIRNSYENSNAPTATIAGAFGITLERLDELIETYGWTRVPMQPIPSPTVGDKLRKMGP